MMDIDWAGIISGHLRSLDGEQVIYYSVWTVLLLAVSFFLFQLLISFRRTSLAKNSARLSLLERAVNQGGLVEKKNLDVEVECWVRDHLIIYAEDDQKFSISMRNKRVLVRDLRGMLPVFRSSPLGFVPTMLTTIGILGTFLGISLGLAEFDPSHVGEDTDALMASSVSMLQGMKTAFYTSLVGMGASILFAFFGIAGLGSWERGRIGKITKAVHYYCTEALPVDYLAALDSEKQSRAADAQLEAAQSMQAAIGLLSDASQRMASAVGGFSSDVIVQGVKDAFQAAVDRDLKPVFSEIAQEMKLLREIKQDNGEKLIQVLTASIREDIVAPISQEIEKTSNMVARSNLAVEGLTSKLGGVMAGFESVSQSIGQFQSETVGRLTQFADSLKDVLGEFRSETSHVLNRVSSEITQALEGSIEGMRQQREAFQASSQQAADTFSGIRGEFERSMEARTHAEEKMLVERQAAEEQMLKTREDAEQAMFASVSANIDQLLGKASQMFAEQSATLQDVGSMASQLMGTAREELERGLGDIDSKVLAMSGTVQKELETFRVEYQSRLSSFFEEQNELIGQALERQKGTLEGVIDDYRKTFEEDHQRRLQMFETLSSSHAQLQESAQTVQALVENVGMLDAATMANLQSVASEIGRQAGQLGKRYAEASEAFTGMTADLPKAMDEYFTRANTSFEGFFRDFDKAAGNIHRRLAEAAEYLVTGAIEQRRLLAEEAEA